MRSFWTIFLFISLFLFPSFAFPQKSLKADIRVMQNMLEDEDFYGAYSLAKKVLTADPKNEKAATVLGASAFKLNFQLDSIIPYFSNFSASSSPDSKFYLALILHRQKQFDEAVGLLEKYQSTPPKKRFHDNDEIAYRIKQNQNAKQFMSAPKRSVIKNIGPEINSASADYVPVVVPDESTLYFTSRREGSSNNSKDAYGRLHEDIYVSQKVNDKWQKAVNLGSPLNTETNDACVAISPDGQRMIIFRTASDIISGDLYVTKIGENGKWEEAIKFGNEINSQFVETSACFSNDTGSIYFSSNRPGGYGGKDIYRIKRLPNGRWAIPYNLGPTVNTVYDEDAPYLHPDGVTLYFSSKGHNSMGEYDVFKSVLNEETNRFSQAENLGYPINTVENDIFFVMSVDGRRAWYSSVKDETFGGNDIYEIDTRFGDNDLKVKHGIAFKENIPAKLKITLLDNEGNQVNGTYFSNPKTGKFILVMNPLKSYRAIVEAEGFTTIVQEIEPLAFEKEEKNLEFNLKKAESK